MYNKNTIRRIVATVLLLIVTTGAFVTLTRTLWVTTILVLILVWFFYLKSENKLSIYKIILLVIIVSLPLYLIRDMGVSSAQKKSQINNVEYRTQSVANPLEDSSFLMRVELAYYAFQRFLENPVFGKGPGDFLKYQIFNINDAPNYYIDNSWLYILWKGGLVGFLLFAWLYIRFFKASYFVFKNTSDIRVKYISLGLLGGFIGLSFLGFLSPLLIKYKTNALIAFFFAYIEFERLKIVNDSRSEKTLSVKA
ncbi:MAG: O-antigen ligase family protein [Bacteroidetes bacterium]|nr:O-antigen ligase family protein [Bacteroidota bacterium]